VHRSVRQKVIGGAAVAVLIAGGALAAVSATGQSNPHAAAAARRSVHARELATAATYLGLPRPQLSEQLRDGKTLAQIAGTTSGKSAQGLIEALEAARKSQLGSAAARLNTRITREVDRPGGPGGGTQVRLRGLFARPSGVGAVAAGYLGVSNASLKQQLSSGKTLAQLADASAGKSEAGLIAALLAPKLSKLERAAAARRLDSSKLAKRRARLELRMTRLVKRRLAGAASRG
jgi:hypothetical protein